MLGDKLPDVLTGRKLVALPEHKGGDMKDLAEQMMVLTKRERAQLMKMIGGET